MRHPQIAWMPLRSWMPLGSWRPLGSWMPLGSWVPRSSSMLLAAGALTVSGLPAIAGCVVYDPELVTMRDAGLDSAARDASSDGGPGDAAPPDAELPDGGPPDGGPPDGGPVCDPRHAPTSTAPVAGERDLLFALRDVVIDQRDGVWETIGYDVDDLCTTVADPRGACPPPSGDAPPVDGMRGIDNSFGKELLAIAITYIPALETDARLDMHEGRASMLVSIRGWNGEDDDGRVDVFLAQTSRGESGPVAMPTPPMWNGGDRWYATTGDFVDGDPTMPLVRDDVAYITDRVLVMRIPDGREIVFPWADNVMHVALTQGLLIGRISEDEGTLEDVSILGRWSLLDINEALTASGICPGDVVRAFVDSALRRNADVRANPATDGTGASCDALSVAIGFTGIAATLGGLDVVPPGTPPCPPP